MVFVPTLDKEAIPVPVQQVMMGPIVNWKLMTVNRCHVKMEAYVRTQVLDSNVNVRMDLPADGVTR